MTTADSCRSPVHEASRPDLAIIGWTLRGARLRELAEDLGGTVRVIFTPRLTAKPLLGIRYLTCALIMIGHLIRRRPRTVIVVNPPVWPGIIGLAYARVRGGRFFLDSHPGGFGAQGHTVEARLQRLHRFLVRHADGVLVACDHWVDVVESWGGRAVVVHEPLRDRGAAGSASNHGLPATRPDRPVALFVCIFAPDEPVAEVIGAARLQPGVDWWITGDPERAPSGLLDGLPENVRLTGYLGPEQYDAALRKADTVIALTTEPTSIMRAAYEAVDARVPLVVSDHPMITATFPFAVPTPNSADGLAESVGSITADLARARSNTGAARLDHAMRWQRQLADLARLVDEKPARHHPQPA